jgi:hypothetical protein
MILLGVTIIILFFMQYPETLNDIFGKSISVSAAPAMSQQSVNNFTTYTIPSYGGGGSTAPTQVVPLATEIPVILDDAETATYGAYWISASSIDATTRLADISQGYSVFVMGGNSEPYLLPLDKLSSADILRYRHIGCNSASKYHSSCNINDIKDDTWWLHRNGTKVCDWYYKSGSSYYNKVCYLDLSNKDVREYMINYYLKAINNTAYNGIFIDIAHDSLYYYGGATDEIKTDSEALNSYKLFLQETKTTLNSKGYKVMPNFAGVSTRGHWDDLIGFTDGAMEEGFFTASNGKKLSNKTIDRQLSDCRLTVSSGKYYLAVVKIVGNESEKQDIIRDAKTKLDECQSSKAILGFRGSNYGSGTVLEGLDLR